MKLANALILAEKGYKIRHESWNEGIYVEGVYNLVLALKNFSNEQDSLYGWRKYKE